MFLFDKGADHWLMPAYSKYAQKDRKTSCFTMQKPQFAFFSGLCFKCLITCMRLSFKPTSVALRLYQLFKIHRGEPAFCCASVMLAYDPTCRTASFYSQMPSQLTLPLLFCPFAGCYVVSDNLCLALGAIAEK